MTIGCHYFVYKEPNSGEALKLLILNHNRKIIGGWTNHSGIVISQKIYVNIMGYRGSKSVFTVKEQRVDGSSINY